MTSELKKHLDMFQPPGHDVSISILICRVDVDVRKPVIPQSRRQVHTARKHVHINKVALMIKSIHAHTNPGINM